MRQSFIVLQSIYLIQVLSWQYIEAINISLTLQTLSISASNRQSLLVTIIIDVDVAVKIQSISYYNIFESTKTRSTNSVDKQINIFIDIFFNLWVTFFDFSLSADWPHYIFLTATLYRTNLLSLSNLLSESTL